MLRHRRSLDLQCEMNLTNLLDTAFVLLIAFMLMAPALKTGVELNLPKVAKGSGPLSTSPQSTVTIVVGKMIADKEAAPTGDKPADATADKASDAVTNPIFIEDQRYDLEEMATYLKKKKDETEVLSVVIEADREVPWESMARVLARVKSIGVNKVGLVFQPK